MELAPEFTPVHLARITGRVTTTATVPGQPPVRQEYTDQSVYVCRNYAHQDSEVRRLELVNGKRVDEAICGHIALSHAKLYCDWVALYRSRRTRLDFRSYARSQGA